MIEAGVVGLVVLLCIAMAFTSGTTMRREAGVPLAILAGLAIWAVLIHWVLR
jgi:hypothetical protein